jgi:predicted O-linked N-acetylglucosamine transferase (SPINDLY family)
MDYYLSAAQFEPDNAQQFYSETLIPLPGIGAYYEPLRLDTGDVDLAALGIARDAPVLVSAGMPSKYAAEYDDVLLDIARALSRCQIVLFESGSRAVSARLLARLHSRFRAGGMDPERYLVMVPWQAPARFFALMQRADVYLDTLGFSGFNTVMQAVECALPVVGYEGRFMRGRFASGILRAMGLPELVARDTAEYVRLAIRLATDQEYRAAMRARIAENRHALYRDQRVIDALTELLVGLTADQAPLGSCEAME